MKYKISIYFANKLNSLDLIFYSYGEYKKTLDELDDNIEYSWTIKSQWYNIKLDHICYYKWFTSMS